MKRLLCLLGLHDWWWHSYVEPGSPEANWYTVRHAARCCMVCDKQEAFDEDDDSGDGIPQIVAEDNWVVLQPSDIWQPDYAPWWSDRAAEDYGWQS